MLLTCGAGEDSWQSLGLPGNEPVNPKGNQCWIFLGRTDAETEAPILWPPDAKNWLTEKDPDAGEDWRQEEKGMTEDEMVGWHHRLDGHKFERAPGVGDGQGSLACCRLQSQTQLSDWTELNCFVQKVCSLYFQLDFYCKRCHHLTESFFFSVSSFAPK